MRILACHNYYRYRGGEDQSFESEVEMLRDHGHEVVTYTRSNDSITESVMGKLQASAQTIHSRSAAREVEQLIRQHRPDVLHANNLFPQISPSIFRPAKRAGVAIVQSLRNYRTFCANSFFFRDGRVCTQCRDRTAAFASIWHGCYRDSSVASTVVTAMQLAHRAKESRDPHVDLYLTPTEFARQQYIAGGFDGDRIHVKPNFIHPDPGLGDAGSEGFVFVGRLSREKGLSTVIEAWEDLDVSLTIIGDGPLKESVEAFAGRHASVEYLGLQNHDEVIRRLGQARSLLMPSLWFETFGRTIAEAFSRGTPVVASRLGAMADLITDGNNGLLFEAGDAAALRHAVRSMADMPPSRYAAMRASARSEFEERFSREANYSKLIDIYSAARDGNEG